MSDSPESLELLRSIDASLKQLVAASKQKAARRVKEEPTLQHRAVDPCPDCLRRAVCTVPCLHKEEYNAGQRAAKDQAARDRKPPEGGAA